MGLFSRAPKTKDALGALANAVASVVAPTQSITVSETARPLGTERFSLFKKAEPKGYNLTFKNAVSKELKISLLYNIRAALPENTQATIRHSSSDKLLYIDLPPGEEKSFVENIVNFTEKINGHAGSLRRQRQMAQDCSDDAKEVLPAGPMAFAGRQLKNNIESTPFLYISRGEREQPRFGVRVRYVATDLAKAFNAKLQDDGPFKDLNAVFDVKHKPEQKLANRDGLVEIAYSIPVESSYIKDSLEKLGVSLPKERVVGEFANDMTPLNDAVEESVRRLGPLLGDGYKKSQDESTKVTIESKGGNFVVRIAFSGRVQKLPSRALDRIMQHALDDAGIKDSIKKYHPASFDPTNMGEAVLEITVPQEEAKKFTKAVYAITKKIMDSEELKAECKKGTEAAIAVWESSGKVKPQLVLRIPEEDEFNRETHFFLRIDDIPEAAAETFRTALPPLDSNDLSSPRVTESRGQKVIVLPLGQTYPDEAVEALKQALEQSRSASR